MSAHSVGDGDPNRSPLLAGDFIPVLMLRDQIILNCGAPRGCQFLDSEVACHNIPPGLARDTLILLWQSMLRRIKICCALGQKVGQLRELVSGQPDALTYDEFKARLIAIIGDPDDFEKKLQALND